MLAQDYLFVGVDIDVLGLLFGLALLSRGFVVLLVRRCEHVFVNWWCDIFIVRLEPMSEDLIVDCFIVNLKFISE